MNSSAAAMRADYEVFLSFRGPDTRLTFTDCLYEAMSNTGIRVFRDDEELRFGEEIGGKLLRAIESSKIWIPIFSKDYASSVWCLQEVAHMVECRRNSTGKEILPVFYDVEATDVKLRTELYKSSLQRHEKKFGSEKVKQWREALREVAKIRGWDGNDTAQGKLIKVIVQEVLSKLKTRQRSLPDHFLGMDDQVEAVMDLLDTYSMDVRSVVIHGMGGIGKTTLAKAIFNKIYSQFQSCSFLSNVRESSQRGDIVKLQKQLLSDLLKSRSIEISDIDDGINMLKERCLSKKVLIVLDDIDNGDQLTNLGGKPDWFDSGSRIIITTRDTSFLVAEEERLHDNYMVESTELYIYEMREMCPKHALQLFSLCAFRTDFPPRDFNDLSGEVVATMGGLPLALEVVGSFLHRKGHVIWKETLKKLQKMPHKEVQKKLMISYEALEYEEKQIFLDIACFFTDEREGDASYFWDACEFYPKSGIIVLMHMSLIKIIDHDKIWMHDQLRDLGRDIVHQESRQRPGRCSRLWSPEVALNVILEKEGTDDVEALNLEAPNQMWSLTSEEIARLVKLRFLKLDGGKLVGDFENTFSKLRWLSWYHCPAEFQATNLKLRNLVVLKLSGMYITECWRGWDHIKEAKNLKVLNITGCEYLTRVPDFSTFSTLERLILEDCERLVEIDSSIGELKCLVHLEINGRNSMEELPAGSSLDKLGLARLYRELSDSAGELNSLIELPESIGNLKRLSVLRVKHIKIGKLPDSIGRLESLLELDVSGTEITDLPVSIGDLTRLEVIRMSCSKVRKLPHSIGRVESLLQLDLSLTKITDLPDVIGNLKLLKEINLDWSEIRQLPEAIGMMGNLEKLLARCCRNLQGEIPSEISGLSSLRILNLSNSGISRLPTTIDQLTHLQELHLQCCEDLQVLPGLPTSLTSLDFRSSTLQTVPDLSNMTNLVDLSISDGTDGIDFGSRVERGQVQAQNMEWVARLTRLEKLALVLSDSMPLIDLSPLSRLQCLKISCFDPNSLMQLPSSLKSLTLVGFESPINWSSLSYLNNLYTLMIQRSGLKKIQLDVLGQLKNLQSLQVSRCMSLERLSVLSHLKELKLLWVSQCPKLTEVRGFEELEMLQCLVIHKCDSIKRLPDLSSLDKLKKLYIHDCKSLEQLPQVGTSCDLVVD